MVADGKRRQQKDELEFGDVILLAQQQRSDTVQLERMIGACGILSAQAEDPAAVLSLSAPSC